MITLPCPGDGCDGQLSTPKPAIANLCRCSRCGRLVCIVAGKDEGKYLVYEVQRSPDRLRKGDVVVVSSRIWYVGKPCETVYYLAKLSAGGKRPRDQDGAYVDTLSIVGKISDKCVEVQCE